MNNLMQALKFQLASSSKIYIANFITVFIGTALVFFLGQNTLENYAYIITLEFIFTIALGFYNYKVIGKTYYSLKHDRKYFVTSSIIMNILNALLMLIAYFTITLLTKNQINVINILTYLLSFILIYSLANAYALYISNMKQVNLISLIIITLFIILFGYFLRDALISLTECFITSNENLNPNLLIVISLVLVIIFNILNSIKYKKTY